MSTPNFDTRYTTPSQVDAKIATQATTDSNQYATKTSLQSETTRAQLAESTRRIISPRLGVFGDSLSQNGDTATARFNSPLFWATTLSGGRLLYSYMGGVSGQTSTQIAARINDATSSNADTIVLLMGTNDGSGTGPFLGTGGTKANLDTCVNALLADGKTPILTTMPPRGTSSQGPSTSQQTFIATYNAYVRRLAAKLGLPLVDYYSIFADTTGDYYNATYQGDGVHPVPAGFRQMGLAIFNALSPYLPPNSSPLPVVNTDRASLIGNNLFLTGGGGTAYPTGWSGQNSGFDNATVSTVSTSVGNACKLTFSGTTSQKVIERDNVTVTAGRRLQFVFEAAWSGVAPAFQVDTYTGSMNYGVFKPLANPPIDQTTPVTIAAEWTVPTGVTYINFELVVGAGATGWMQIGRVAVYDLTALGIDTFVNNP